MSAQITRITRKLGRLGMGWSQPDKAQVGYYLIYDGPVWLYARQVRFSSLAKLERWLKLTWLLTTDIRLNCLDTHYLLWSAERCNICRQWAEDRILLEQARRELEG